MLFHVKIFVHAYYSSLWKHRCHYSFIWHKHNTWLLAFYGDIMILVWTWTYLYLLGLLWRKEGWKWVWFCWKIEVFWSVVKFSTLRNTKETLANFSKILRVSLFRVPTFLACAWSSFGSISTQETRSKRLDTVEAKNCRICPVMEIIKFSALAAFKPLRDLKTNRRWLKHLSRKSSTSRFRVREFELWIFKHQSSCRDCNRTAVEFSKFSGCATTESSKNLEIQILDWNTFPKSPQLRDSEFGSSSYGFLNISHRVGTVAGQQYNSANSVAVRPLNPPKT